VTPLEAIAVFVSGIAAGGINAVVGSGTLITFPTLLAIGYPPVVANVSNNIGLAPGSFSGALGYRRELAGQRQRLIRLGAASAIGGLTGGLLLLRLPADAFSAIVPVLIIIGCVLVVIQPWLTSRIATRHDAPSHGSAWTWGFVFLAGVYGGYFGAAQGVLLIAILGIGLDEGMQRVNAAKNVLSTIVNSVAALLFILIADVAWEVVGLIAAGSIIGGQLGATLGRRLPSPVFRGFVVFVGVAAVIKLVIID
jgi:uncharacterized membrane protein YfcA